MKRKILFIVLMVTFGSYFLIVPEKTIASPSVSITTSPATVGKYEKFEVVFTLGGVNYSNVNPFNPNISSPGGTEPYQKPGLKVDGYFRKVGESSWPILQPAFYDGNGNWKLRFAPKTLGNWEYKIRAEDSTGANESTPRTFAVTDTQNPGFLQVNPNDTRFFQFENGTPFTPIGTATSGIGTDSSSLSAIDKMGQNGMNFTRVFLNSTQIEVMGTDSTPAKCSDLNNYSLTRASNVDSILNHAKSAGVYVEWVQEDWEKLYDRTPPAAIKNTYVACGSAVSANVSEMFSNYQAREIYQRKLRYIAARWGYSTNLMAIELVNELGGATGDKDWHIAMGNYYHGLTPYSKHLVSSSNGSEELRLGGGIPWDNAAMDFVNYHSYGRCGTTWANSKFDTQLEKLGSLEGLPWLDSAVWADRVVRAYRGNSWSKKPFLWTEFGLIKIVNGAWQDWNTMYNSDTAGRHLRDALWASTLNGYAINHWKNDYVNGVGAYAPDKYSAFRSLANYLDGLSLAGLKQETTYPVSDSRNTNPTIVSNNSNINVVAMRGSDKGYFYVKNATVPWVDVNSTELGYCGSVATPNAADQSGTFQVKGLNQGSYVLEKWSTVDTNKATQILEKKALTVGTDGIASIPISLGTNHNPSNFTDSYDFAYKLYQGGVVTISSATDKTTADVGETVTITNQITNGKVTVENNLNFTDYLPYRTSLESFDAGGVVGSKSISCAEVSNYNYPSCSGSFAIPTVTWSGISVNPGTSRYFNVVVKISPLSGSSPSPSPSSPPPVSPSPTQTLPPSPPPSSDTISPEVTISTPADGTQNISRNFFFLTKHYLAIKASATDNIRVVRMELFIDRTIKANVAQNYLSYDWDVRGASKGAHDIQIRAYDGAGNVGVKTITVYK